MGEFVREVSVQIRACGVKQGATRRLVGLEGPLAEVAVAARLLSIHGSFPALVTPKPPYGWFLMVSAWMQINGGELIGGVWILRDERSGHVAGSGMGSDERETVEDFVPGTGGGGNALIQDEFGGGEVD